MATDVDADDAQKSPFPGWAIAVARPRRDPRRGRLRDLLAVRPPLLWATGLALLAFVALAFVARGGPTDVDRRIYQLVDPLDIGPGGFDVDALIQFFEPAPWTLLVLATAVLWSRWERGLALLLAMGVTVEFATLGAKLLFALYVPGLLSSFPSGHVTRVAVTGGLVLLWLVLRHHRRLEVAAAAAVVVGVLLAVGAMRVMNGSHQAIDAAGGILLAAVWVLGIAALALARRDIPLLPLDPETLRR